MKQHVKIWKIGIVLGAMLLMYSCAAKDKNAPAEMARMDSAAPPSLSEGSALGLEAEELNKEQLDVFVERAEQKLKDLGDYVAIITDKKYNEEFRKEAKRQALELFGDTAANIQLEGGYPYIDSLYRSSEKIQLRFSDISVIEFPKQVNDKLYLGKLGFSMTVNNMLQADRPDHSLIIIKKVPKQFGSETREVWEVRLGMIRNTGS